MRWRPSLSAQSFILGPEPSLSQLPAVQRGKWKQRMRPAKAKTQRARVSAAVMCLAHRCEYIELSWSVCVCASVRVWAHVCVCVSVCYVYISACVCACSCLLLCLWLKDLGFWASIQTPVNSPQSWARRVGRKGHLIGLFPAWKPCDFKPQSIPVIPRLFEGGTNRQPGNVSSYGQHLHSYTQPPELKGE